MIKKVLISIVVFFFALVVLAPKFFVVSVIQDKLLENQIEFEYKKYTQNYALLEFHDTEVAYSGLEILQSQKCFVKIYGFHNSFEFSKASLPLLREKFEVVRFDYSLFSPLHVRLFAESLSGSMEGKISLIDKKGLIRFIPVDVKKIPQYVKKIFKIDDQGGYIYEFAI